MSSATSDVILLCQTVESIISNIENVSFNIKDLDIYILHRRNTYLQFKHAIQPIRQISICFLLQRKYLPSVHSHDTFLHVSQSILNQTVFLVNVDK